MPTVFVPRLVYLSDYPSFAPRLAALHYAEWSHFYDNWSSGDALLELQGHLGRREVPTTLVALDGETLLGSASLLKADSEEYQHLSPWLASLFVLPEHRDRGIGKMLVSRIVEEAAALGYARLYLWTAGQRRYYERLGWAFMETTQRSHGPIAILYRELRVVAPQP